MPNRHERECGYDIMRLHEPVREKVLAEWRDSQGEYGWWDCVYEDAKRMGALMGITVDDIQFSGFWSQGDGASFTGQYQCKADAVEAVTAECNDLKLIELAEKLTVLQVECKNRFGDTFDCAIARMRGNEVHDCSMTVSDWGKESFDHRSYDDLRSLTRDFCAVFRAFARWIYKSLEAEYEHLTSNDSVVEAIRSSELRFDSSGATI